MDSKNRIVLGIFSVVLSGLALPVGFAQGRQDEEGIPSHAYARLKIDKGTAGDSTAASGVPRAAAAEAGEAVPEVPAASGSPC